MPGKAELCYHTHVERAEGRVSEIRVGASGHKEVCIICPQETVPRPGQYLLAVEADDLEASLSTPVFTIEKSNQGFWSSPLHAVRWEPGSILNLLGPLGRGFTLPGGLQRLGVVAVGETVARLLPLVRQALISHTAITLFTDLALPIIPAALEAYPLAALPEALDWPDFMAVDIPLERMPELRSLLDLSTGAVLPCPAQILLTTPMPCSGIAQCGACAVPGRKGWKLACEDGPVFDLSDLKW
jgi:NAD(P)H-flavin reductase